MIKGETIRALRERIKERPSSATVAVEARDLDELLAVLEHHRLAHTFCQHPPPGELEQIWCSACGAWKPSKESPVVYLSGGTDRRALEGASRDQLEALATSALAALLEGSDGLRTQREIEATASVGIRTQRALWLGDIPSPVEEMLLAKARLRGASSTSVLVHCDHCLERRVMSEAVPGFIWWCRSCLDDWRVPVDLRLKPSADPASGRWFAPTEAVRLRRAVDRFPKAEVGETKILATTYVGTSDRSCAHCARPEATHVWVCDCGALRQTDAEGLPYPCTRRCGLAGATFYCTATG